MISRMTRYDFLVFHAEYNSFLKKLRDVGVLHVTQPNEGIQETDELLQKMQLKSAVSRTIEHAKALLSKEDSPSVRSTSVFDEGIALINDFDSKEAEINRIKTEINALCSLSAQMSVWGVFSPERLATLAENGIKVDFQSCPIARFNPEWKGVFEISNNGATTFFVKVSTPSEPAEDIEADSVQMANRDYKHIDEEIAKLKSELSSCENELKQFAIANLENFNEVLLQIDDLINFDNVLLSTAHAAENTVMLLEGYCPDECQDALKTMLETEGVYYESHQPKLTDNVPIKLKNNAFSRLFEPIMKLYSLPNYSELDPTPFIAPFFMLFFGLCLGDGGYGLIILLLCTLIKNKVSSGKRDLISLGQWLGAATLFAGLLTGSFFGVSLDSVTWPWLANIKHYFLTDANYKAQLGGYSPMMILAVVIGLVQIFFGMAVNSAKIIKQHGIKYALAPIAWITGLLGTAACYGLPALGIAIPVILNYIFYALIALSVLLIVLYNSPDSYSNPVGGFFKNIGSALWATYNMATGLLGDTLSYIRLFALGLTGSILGSVFNQLAFQFGGMVPVPGLDWLVILFILIFGHSLNFGLNMIGAFVHPLRLTFVEYYKNSGFEGGGQAYNPFHKLSAEK
ncbi:MAG: ATPase [bacterium]|nr:ATPase [Candidatus Minthenecus merdequi]